MELRMNVHRTALPGVFIVEAAPVIDQRGAFSRYYCERDMAAVIGGRRIVQINHSRTSSVGTVRGLHYQRPPHAEMKLVRCLKGRVWDVAVDLRAGSPTFLQWHAEELFPGNASMMVIPEGCAHGFQVLEKDSELLYLHTAFYEVDSEGGIYYNDRQLGIPWPLPVVNLSSRDASYPPIDRNFFGIDV